MDMLTSAGIPYFFMFDFELVKPMVFRLDELPEWVKIAVPNFCNHTFSEDRLPIDLSVEPPSREVYARAFTRVLEQINYGNSYLTNLTFRSSLVDFDATLGDVFDMAAAKYKLLYGEEFVVFSPEPFVKIHAGDISTFPMKGTRLAHSIMDGKALLDDPKEAAEHATIVDLMRNDLSMVASQVAVKDYRYMEILKSRGNTLFQSSSRIQGRLKAEYSSAFGSIFAQLLPAGSISGAPKQKTVDIIRSVELDKRGYYTGVFGVFDGTSLESAVMIRYIEKVADQYYFRSGGGITSNSTLDAEYDELIQKIYVPIS